MTYVIWDWPKLKKQALLAGLTAANKLMATRWKPPHSLSSRVWLLTYLYVAYLELSTAQVNGAKEAIVAWQPQPSMPIRMMLHGRWGVCIWGFCIFICCFYFLYEPFFHSLFNWEYIYFSLSETYNCLSSVCFIWESIYSIKQKTDHKIFFLEQIYI